MDEQGIYCPQCRGYVHFWFLSQGRRPPEAGGAQQAAPGSAIEMPESCKQCGYKSTYKTSDLRTRRVPTMAGLSATPPADARRVATIDVPKESDDE
jgi:hypothetical protein